MTTFRLGMSREPEAGQCKFAAVSVVRCSAFGMWGMHKIEKGCDCQLAAHSKPSETGRRICASKRDVGLLPYHLLAVCMNVSMMTQVSKSVLAPLERIKMDMVSPLPSSACLAC